MATREITFREAIVEALREEMLRDERVLILGENICDGPDGYGGAFAVTKGLVAECSDRMLDTPIAEQTIVGASVGAAMTGLRPVAELMYEDFITLAMESLVNLAAKKHAITNGGYRVPMVVRAACGATGSGSAHSQVWTSWFMNVPGLYVAFPSTPYDAKGLLKTAIRDDNPVLFLEHKKLYGVKGEVPEEEYLVELGQARVLLPGDDVTVVAIGQLAHLATQVAAEVRGQGISLEVVDPRTLAPLDLASMVRSVRKTHRLVVAAEDCRTAGPTAEIAAAIGEAAFEYLDAPIGRVGAMDAIIAHNPGMARYVLPGAAQLKEAVRRVIDWS
jgi:pyruvate/2-oxoglutarate/acetoin dehydrogenase E1 component